MADKDRETTDEFTLPGGRLINSSFWVKDQFNDKAVPSYKSEIAIPKDSEELADLEDRLIRAADDHWGKGAGDDEDLVIPFISGDKLAKKREKRGKDGDAYRGMTVIRANTIYNLHGDDAPGGIDVFDQDVERISPANQGQIYNGCYGEVGVVIGFYEDDDGNNAMKFYLNSFQKTKDGERLRKSSDRSSLFKPVGREEGSGGKRKRRRNRSQDDD